MANTIGQTGRSSVSRYYGGQSELERTFAYYYNLLTADAPQYELEYVFLPGRKYRFDFAWPASKVAVEIQGGTRLKGGGRHNTDVDRWKMNHAATNGWRVLQFSGKMLEDDPQQCIKVVLEALAWNG